MLVHLSLFILRRLGKCAPALDEEILPPANLVHSGIIDASGSVEGVDGSLAGLVVLGFDHHIDGLELVVNLLEDNLILIIEHLLILLHLDVHMLDSFQFLVQNPEIVLVVPGNVGD